LDYAYYCCDSHDVDVVVVDYDKDNEIIDI
jgi:hypothetical protein